MSGMIRFSYVSREIRSIVARRREILIFLASLFAAVGIYLQNLSLESLPAGLTALREHALLTYALIVGIPSILLALRIARLHGGMVINGLFYRALLNKPLTYRLNVSGVSTQMFVLSALISAWAAWLLLASVLQSFWFSGAFALLAFLLMLGFFMYNDQQSARFALRILEKVTLVPPNNDDIIEHQALSLQDANQDLLSLLTFTGLMLFAVLQTFSGFGEVEILPPGFPYESLSFAYLLLGLVVSIIALIMYLRLVLSVGQFSLALNPADRPFAPWRLTDSFLGYLLLGFFAVIPAHLLLYPWLNSLAWSMSASLLLIIWLIYPLWQMHAAGLISPDTSLAALGVSDPAEDPPKKTPKDPLASPPAASHNQE